MYLLQHVVIDKWWYNSQQLTTPSSTATHRVTEGQDTAVSLFVMSTLLTVQLGVVLVGSVGVMTCPAVSTATQSPADGQETPEKALMVDHGA